MRLKVKYFSFVNVLDAKVAFSTLYDLLNERDNAEPFVVKQTSQLQFWTCWTGSSLTVKSSLIEMKVCFVSAEQLVEDFPRILWSFEDFILKITFISDCCAIVPTLSGSMGWYVETTMVKIVPVVRLGFNYFVKRSGITFATTITHSLLQKIKYF